MAMVWKNEIHGGTADQVPGAGDKYTRVFQIKMAASDSAYDACDATGINPGAAYPDDTDAVAVRRTAQLENPDQDRTIWLVTVYYEEPTESTPQDDPTNDDTQIHWGSYVVAEALAKDRNGDPILTSAGEPYDPPLMQDRHLPMVTITRNESSFDPADADTYKDTVNSGNITIAGLTVSARKALMLDIDCDRQKRAGTTYYRVTYQIAFDKDTFDRDPLDQGLRCRYYAAEGSGSGSPGDLPLKPCVIHGQEVTTPARLDGSGGQLADNASADDSEYLAFETYTTADWSSLSLPSSM